MLNLFQLFKDCLVHPKRIANYVDNSNKKFIGFFIILLLINIFPTMLIVATQNTFSSELVEDISAEFEFGDQLHYELKDGKLISSENAGTEYLSTQVYISNQIVDFAYVFDITGETYHIENNLKSSAYVLIVFTEDNVQLYGGTKALGSNPEDKMKLFEKSYVDLGITDIAFNNCKGQNHINFYFQFSAFLNSLFKSVKNKYLPLIIIGIILSMSISYLVLILMISLLELLFYHMLGVKFGKIFKIVAYATTPYLVLNFISTFTGLTFLNFIGELILVIYAMKAISTYALLSQIKKL